MNKLVYSLLLVIGVGSQAHADLVVEPLLYNLGNEGCVYLKNNTLIDAPICAPDALSATVKVLTSHEMSTSSGQRFVVETVMLQAMTASGALVFREATRLRLVE